MGWNKGTSFRQPVQGFDSRQPVQETTLKSQSIQIERKTIHLSVRENARGRFLRITEEVDGRYNSVVIPATGLEGFKKLVSEMIEPGV